MIYRVEISMHTRDDSGVYACNAIVNRAFHKKSALVAYLTERYQGWTREPTSIAGKQVGYVYRNIVETQEDYVSITSEEIVLLDEDTEER